jgi:hypothetical protein
MLRLVAVDVERHVPDERVNDQKSGTDPLDLAGDGVEVVREGDVTVETVTPHLDDVDPVKVGAGGDQAGKDDTLGVVFARSDHHIDRGPRNLPGSFPRAACAAFA